MKLSTIFYHVLKDFCGVVSEESLQENLLLVLEVLNIFLDFGYVQLSTTDKLQPHIQSTPVLTRIKRQPTQHITSRVFGIETKTSPIPATDRPVISSSVQKDKRKNELYVDVIEKITSVINADGSVSRLEVNGAMKVKNFLFGSPQVKVVLNNNIIVQRNSRIKAYGDNVQLDICVFHESAKVDNVDTPSVLTICPKVGEFTLMSYSVSGESSITSPFHFVSSVQPLEHSRDVMVCLRIKNMLSVTSVNLRLKFGVPQSVSNISQHLDSCEQTATLEKTDSTILWKLKSLAPHAESVAQFRLISQSGALKREDVGPLRMEFEISGHLLSGMKIKTVKIVNQEQTTPQKWLRYITVSDSFLVKLV
ncbi:AP-4 complex subunit mu-1-like isoform X1 [Saccostrea cucullata]|uniref:AP-4 complex subunit mu-1-like isoform X1 n=1 Tax=Saccostrea cuccullata TaxID=36930 RepID=UPI002ED26CFF